MRTSVCVKRRSGESNIFEGVPWVKKLRVQRTCKGVNRPTFGPAFSDVKALDVVFGRGQLSSVLTALRRRTAAMTEGETWKACKTRDQAMHRMASHSLKAINVLHTWKVPLTEEAATKAANHGDFGIVRAALKQGVVSPNMHILKQAVQYRDVGTVAMLPKKWLVSHINPKIYALALHNEDTQMVVLLERHGAMAAAVTFTEVARLGNLAVLKQLVSLPLVRYTSQALMAAVQSGHLNVVEWMLATFQIFLDSNVVRCAVSGDNVAIARCLYQHAANHFINFVDVRHTIDSVAPAMLDWLISITTTRGNVLLLALERCMHANNVEMFRHIVQNYDIASEGFLLLNTWKTCIFKQRVQLLRVLQECKQPLIHPRSRELRMDYTSTFLPAARAGNCDVLDILLAETPLVLDVVRNLGAENRPHVITWLARHDNN